MNSKIAFAVLALAPFALAAGPAYAGEGSGDPFAFRAALQHTSGAPFVADTGSSAYPELTGNTVQLSTLATLSPAAGAEAAVQTAASMPVHADEGTVVYAQTQINRAWATRTRATRVLVTGDVLPRG